MSFQPFILPSVNGVSNPIHDDNQYYDTYADILAEANKSDMVTYVARDSGNRYTWDGNNLIFLIGSSGAIMSASNVGTGNGVYKQLVSNNLEFKTLKGTTDQVNISNNTNDLTLSLPQSIATTSAPSFASIDVTNKGTTRLNLGLGDATAVTNGQLLIGSSTGNNFVKAVATGDPTYITAQAGDGTLAITLANQAKTKLDNAIQSVTSANTNLLTVSGTTNLTLTNLIGGGEPLLYTYSTSGGPNPGTNELKIASGGNFTVATTMSISYTAINRSDNNFVKTYFRTMSDNNWEILLLNDNNVDDYACFHVTSIASIGANFITLNITYDATNSASTSFTNPTNVKLFVAFVDRVPSSSNTNLIEVVNTSTTSTLTNKVGTHQSAILRIDTVQTDNQKITTNNNANLALATQLNIGRLPFNASNNEYFYHFLDVLQFKGLPVRLRCTITGNPSQYAEFILTSSNGSTANAYQFFATFDASPSRSTISSFTTGAFVYLNFMPTTQTIAGGSSKLSSTLSSNNETVTLDVVESNFNSDNFGNIKRLKKNNLKYTDMIVHVFGAGGQYVPNSISYTANESMDLILQSALDTTEGCAVSFMLDKYPQRAFLARPGTKNNLAFAVQLIGSGWQGEDLQFLRVGFITEQWIQNIESNASSATAMFQCVWNTAITSNNRGFTASFLGATTRQNVNGASNSVGRTGTNTTTSIASQNDILLISFDHATNAFVLYWYNSAGVQQSVGFNVLTSGGYSISNFNSGKIYPWLSVARRGSTYGLRIMSERDLIASGVNLANFEPCYY